jgi:hypothetical protein
MSSREDLGDGERDVNAPAVDADEASGIRPEFGPKQISLPDLPLVFVIPNHEELTWIIHDKVDKLHDRVDVVEAKINQLSRDIADVKAGVDSVFRFCARTPSGEALNNVVGQTRAKVEEILKEVS